MTLIQLSKVLKYLAGQVKLRAFAVIHEASRTAKQNLPRTNPMSQLLNYLLKQTEIIHIERAGPTPLTPKLRGADANPHL